jgi:hypothetical protein
VRIAVSGSHSTGKSTLIAAFVARRPEFVYEPEAYETLADDIDLTSSGGPDLDGLAALIRYTNAALLEARAHPRAAVIFERSPVDYLAYAAASRAAPGSERRRFVEAHIPGVREAIGVLDLIVLVPVSRDGPIQARDGEDDRFRRRVDERLRRFLIDDDHDLFGGPDAPRVVELSPDPAQQLAELLRRMPSP